MGERYRRVKARRGTLPTMDRRPVVDASTEGVFPLGLTSGSGPISWEPWAIDHPHLLMTGTTGSGKTRKLEEWAILALHWGWRVTVIDFKGGGDYWAALSNGAELVTHPKEAVLALDKASREIDERNRLMLATPITRERSYDHVEIDDRAVTFGDLPLEIRQEHGLVPWLIVADDIAQLMAYEIPGQPSKPATKTKPAQKYVKGISGVVSLENGVQLARSAGVHFALGIQRPDAKKLPGFITHNVQSVVGLGAMDSTAEEMIFDSAIVDHPERSLPRPTGTGFAKNVGGRHIARVHLSLLDRERYLPLHVSPESAERIAERLAAAASASPDDPASPVLGASPTASGSDLLGRGPLLWDGVGRGRPFRGPPPAGASPAPQGVASRIGSALRPVLTGPPVRLWLRARRLRLLVVPVKPPPHVRDPFLSVECKQQDGYRCRACGAGPPVEATHDRPIAFSGEDDLSNMRTLCERCHLAESKPEGWIWRLRQREVRRGVPAAALTSWWGIGRRMPLWLWAGILTFLAGLVTGSSWWWLAGLCLFATTLLPPLMRRYLVPKFLRKLRGPGLDGRGTWDDERERERYDGYLKFLVRRAQGGRNTAVAFRYGLMGLSVVYLLGAGLVALVI